MRKIIGRLDPTDRSVTIWGAGFSGLVLGFELKRQGYKVTILERSGRAGGLIQTRRTKNGPVEFGAHALYVNREVEEFLNELGLEPMPAARKLRRLILINGKPRRPFQLGLLAKLLKDAGKRPPLVSEGLSVAEFFKPLIGQEHLDRFLSPVLGGIYASAVEQLHFKSIFPQVGEKSQFDSYWEFLKLLRKSRKLRPKGSLTGSVSFEGGMQALIERLTEDLRGSIKFNYREKFQLKGNTIICTDALNAAKLLAETLPNVSTELARIKYLPLTSATVFLRRELRPLSRSFGLLIPPGKTLHSIGVINNKAVFPVNYPNTFSYTFISKEKVTREDILQDLRSLSPEVSAEDIDFFDASHMDRSLPAYDLQRYLTVKRLHQIVGPMGKLAIFGNYVAGISLREMVVAAKEFTQEHA